MEPLLHGDKQLFVSAVTGRKQPHFVDAWNLGEGADELQVSDVGWVECPSVQSYISHIIYPSLPLLLLLGLDLCPLLLLDLLLCLLLLLQLGMLLFDILQLLEVLLSHRKYSRRQFLGLEVECSQRLLRVVLFAALEYHLAQFLGNLLTLGVEGLQDGNEGRKSLLHPLQRSLLFLNILFVCLLVLFVGGVSLLLENLLVSQEGLHNGAEFGQLLFEVEVDLPVGLNLAVFLAVVNLDGWLVGVEALRVHAGHVFGDPGPAGGYCGGGPPVIVGVVWVKLLPELLVALLHLLPE